MLTDIRCVGTLTWWSVRASPILRRAQCEASWDAPEQQTRKSNPEIHISPVHAVPQTDESGDTIRENDIDPKSPTDGRRRLPPRLLQKRYPWERNSKREVEGRGRTKMACGVGCTQMGPDVPQKRSLFSDALEPVML